MKPGQTLSQKLLSAKAGRAVAAGEFLLLRPDVALGNDITAPVAIREFQRFGGRRIHDPDQVVLIPDHFTPNKDIAAAEQAALLRRFAREQNIARYFEVGRLGIEHVMLPEEGLVKSGDLVVGADSHTCTYGGLGAFATGVGSSDLAGVFLTGRVWLKVPEAMHITLQGRPSPYTSGKDLILKLISQIGVDGANYQALEFSGTGVASLSLDSRLAAANMAVEAGAKAGLFPVDHITMEYERERGIEAMPLEADADAAYGSEAAINLSSLQPQVAYPFLPSNGKDADAAEADHIAIDQVIIGSCTNGRMEDLRMAAEILRGRKVHRRVRCIIIPGSQRVYLQALRENLLSLFIEAGCAVSTPTCGPCLGGHMGILAEGERAVATTNRNFVGRMGHAKSEVFLSGPAVAAAAAVAGSIVHPGNVKHNDRQEN